MNKTSPNIGISIVTQNGRQHLEKLLPSLFKQDYEGAFSVYLADNNSTDGTSSWVKEFFPQVSIILFKENKGFAAPNNAVFEELLRDEKIQAVVCLNNDTVISENFLSTVVSGMLFSDDVGAVQTKVVLSEESDRIDSVGITISADTSAISKGQGEKDVGQYEKPGEIFGTTASACLYTRKALEAVRLSDGDYFDSSYFAYNEDVDLAWRMRLAGFSARYVPGARVLHVHSATGGNYSAFKSFYIHRNTLYNIIKDLPGTYCPRGIFLFVARYFSLISSIFKKKGASYQLSKKVGIFATLGIVARAWAHFFWNLPALLKKRRFIQGKRKVPLADIAIWLRAFQADTQAMFYDEKIRKL